MMEPYISQNSKQFFAFNVWSIEAAKAVMDGAARMECDVILQTSMKAFKQLDKEEIRTFVNRYMERKKIHAYLHLDHCREVDFIKEAINYGWDSVMIDASDKTLNDNIQITNDICKMAHKQKILVEAEVGRIPGSEDGVGGTEAGIARIEDIKCFVRNTNVDILAAAVGTAHGFYKGMPRIHYDLIERISRITAIPLAVHGGSGLTEEMLLKILSYKNVKKINVSTEVKLAYRQEIEECIQKECTDRGAFDPLEVERRIHDSVEYMTVNKLKLLKRAE